MSQVREKPMLEEEVKAWLQENLPKWKLEDGWIRRTYKTASWKSTMMVINTIGHLSEAAWHHPDLTASYAWVEVRLMTHSAKGITGKDLALASKNPKRWSLGSRALRARVLKAHRVRTCGLLISSMIDGRSCHPRRLNRPTLQLSMLSCNEHVFHAEPPRTL